MDAIHSQQSESRVLISRKALLHNLSVIRARLRPGVKVCAMVKADAYGHGAALVVDALCNFASGAAGQGVDALAVATVEEAAALPDVPRPVLIFQPVENALVGAQRSAVEEAVRAGWVLTLCSKSAADDVARIAAAAGRRAAVQVMIDTGMARSGVGVSRAAELLERIDAWPSLKLLGVCTHFASAEDPADPFTTEQLRRFEGLTTNLAGRVIRHAANSAGIFLSPESHLDMVRPGLSLYGIDPAGWPCADRTLVPVMKWIAPLVGVREIPAGTGVGYGHAWRAPYDTRLGLVPVGYADGYARALSNRGSVIVCGRTAPVVGRVSMDMLTIDLGEVPQASIGDEVTLLDDDPLSPASAYAVANWSDTIPYEVFVRIGRRMPRVAVAPPDSSADAALREDADRAA